MRAWTALLLAALLAGCSAKPGNPDSGALHTGPASGSATGADAAAAQGLPLPAWAVRDYWTYAIGGAKATYVVTADQGSDWFMDTDSAERAFQNARDDVSRLGPQRKGDLAGSQGADRVEFFHWPLRDGATWATRWDHQPVTIAAHVRGAIADLEATDRNGTRVYDYTYDSAAGWFRSLKHYAPGGALLIDLELVASGHGWTGTAVRYTLKTLYGASGTAGNADAKTVQPDATATDLWLAYHLACGQGGGYLITLGPVPPSQVADGYSASGPCATVDFEGNLTGPLGSQWGLAYSWGGGSPTTYTVELVQRTRQDVKVG